MSDSKPKVILVGPAFPLRGGIANFNEALARALTAAGMETMLVSFSLQYPGFLFPGTTQFDSGEGPKDLHIHTLINSVNPFSWLKTARFIKKQQPDLVLIRFWLPFMGPALGTIAKLISRKKSIKIIAITDNIIPHEKRPGDKQFTGYFLRQCQGFVAMSKSVLDDLQLFVKTDKTAFLPHPIYNIFGDKLDKLEAKRKIGLDPETDYILFFGFIRRYKGLDLLLEAMSDPVMKKRKNLKLIVAGEFYEDAKPYLDLIERNEIADQLVVRTQYIPSEDVKYYFSACELVAQPYRSATQSGVTQIAYQFEVPMLVTNVGGLPEIVEHGKVGYVTGLQPKEIAAALNDFFDNKRRDEFTAHVKQAKERFQWSGFVAGLLELYRHLS